MRNIDAVRDAKTTVPHCEEIISALWLRSLSVDKLAGADPEDLHIDITRSKPIGDNQFEAELATIEGSCPFSAQHFTRDEALASRVAGF